MSRVRVLSFALSLDGYGAVPGQDLHNPFCVGGTELMEWFFRTRTWRRTHDQAGSDSGVDDGFAAQAFDDIGAWILGRNMFGPVRGPRPDDTWRGWWGDEPPYHVPVFVLTHHARRPLEMAGGTTFHFVTDGSQAALARAKEAAGSKDVRVSGGVATSRQYLAAGLIDDLHLALRPIFLGTGERAVHTIIRRSSDV